MSDLKQHLRRSPSFDVFFWCEKQIYIEQKESFEPNRPKASEDVFCQTEAWYQWICGLDREGEIYAREWREVSDSTKAHCVMPAQWVISKLSVYNFIFGTFRFSGATFCSSVSLGQATISPNQKFFVWRSVIFLPFREINWLKQQPIEKSFF